ncbi:MAG TPA: hypothetical protein VFY93_01540 [Planctomycetota bacterium]|nr:hypothetical protein [Planctomycetota bacterium]
MKRACIPLLVLLAACSGKYVRIDASDGRSLYAKKADADKVDPEGYIHVTNAVTGKPAAIKRSDCVIRSASNAEVTRARGNSFVYDK